MRRARSWQVGETPSHHIYRDPADFLAHYDEVTRLDVDRLALVRFLSTASTEGGKNAPHFGGALLCVTQNDALINYNKVRLARADHALRVCKPVHVNRDPAAV